MSKLDLGQRHDHAPLDERGLRVCETEGCGTILSRHNAAVVCAMCSNRLEIGGARIPLPTPVIVGPRPPAPSRPTLEGAVPLPGVIKGPERTYEQMIARTKPDAPAALPTACAQCGHAIPANAEGWLCPKCQRSAAARKGILAAQEIDRRSFDKPLPEPAEPPRTAPPARTVAPKTATRARGTSAGPRRTFDYAEALKLFRECGSYGEVARHFGVTNKGARFAILKELARLGEPAPTLQPGPPRQRARKFDWAAAAQRFVDGASLDEVAEHYGVSPQAIACAVDETLGRERAREIGRERRIAANRRRGRASASAPSNEEPKQEAPPAEPPPLAELDAELTRLEHELEHVAGELGRLYARQGAATKRMTEVIGLMAQSARSAA